MVVVSNLSTRVVPTIFDYIVTSYLGVSLHLQPRSKLLVLKAKPLPPTPVKSGRIEDGCTALMFAAMSGHGPIVSELMKVGKLVVVDVGRRVVVVKVIFLGLLVGG